MGGSYILVVDDDAATRQLLGRALDDANLPCVIARSGAEALAALGRGRPSLVLLDLVMPPPDGYQLLRIFRARHDTRDVPVVVLTGLDAESEIARAFDAGADDFVCKPFKAVELIARVRGQLRLHGVMEALERKEKDASVVLELTQALASNLDFRGILFTVVQRLADVAKVDRVSIVLARESDSVGYVVAASDDEQLRDLPIALPKYPEIQQVLSHGKPLVVGDAATHPLMEIVRTDQHGSPAFASLCILPILYDGRPMGVLFLRSRRVNGFDDRELGLCHTVASAMAIALRNARVLQTLRDRTQEVSDARVAAERRLQSLERYADFFDSSADGIVVVDCEGRLLFSNPKACELTGWGEHDLRGRHVDAIFTAGPSGVSDLIRHGFASGVFAKGVDVRMRARDGTQRVVNVSFASVLREEGAVLCSFRDVTNQRQLEVELVKTKDFLERVIDSSVDAIISADLSGKVVLFNRAAERLYGKKASEVLGTSVRGLYAPRGAEVMMRRIRAGGGRVEGLHVEILAAGGTHVPVLFSGGLIYEGDRPVGSVGIFTDLREKVWMEKRLQKAQEVILAQERQAIVAELAGATAHELNQPLTSIRNYATFLKRALGAEAQRVAAAEVIEVEAERMAEIVRKIGKITRYETKSYVGSQKIVDLDRASALSSASFGLEPECDGPDACVVSASASRSTMPPATSPLPPPELRELQTPRTEGRYE